jgi:hypothetical protein
MVDGAEQIGAAGFIEAQAVGRHVDDEAALGVQREIEELENAGPGEDGKVLMHGNVQRDVETVAGGGGVAGGVEDLEVHDARGGRIVRA